MHRENHIFTVARLSLEESRGSERSPERIEYFAQSFCRLPLAPKCDIDILRSPRGHRVLLRPPADERKDMTCFLFVYRLGENYRVNMFLAIIFSSSDFPADVLFTEKNPNCSRCTGSTVIFICSRRSAIFKMANADKST
jgi:hypothetical protein